ncbi:response regulator [Zooshikella ganghwensis]|uniref:Response regulator n=1 Tax=Zooshikella ganghwensis TaxID=202772 RepID=A0A4P9VPA0_9GAMM|nr:response regulator [Zooshikella ganghwensis]RDH45318.1 response regulator [Zooshikella ganghwensis]
MNVAMSYNKSVFIINNDRHTLNTISEVCQRLNIEAKTLSSGAQLLAELDHEAPLCIFSAPILADMDSSALLQHIQQLNDELPVLMVGQSGDVHCAVNAIKQGALDFFTKPVNSRRIQIILQALLAKDHE